MHNLNSAEKITIEEDLLLETIFRCYGYDFRDYSKDYLSRRFQHCLQVFNQKTLSEFIPKILYDENFFGRLLVCLLVSVTEMFRDPSFFCEFKNKVLPVLKTYPFVKIWHAGCSTGQEVYSMAILLEENGLLNRTTIYATDINVAALKFAREAIYPLEDIKKYEINYQKAGGSHTLSKYFYNKYNYGKFSDNLKNKIIFSNHNLISDEIFTEVHVIICRNVFIYFTKKLQQQTTLMFYQSLIHKGFLCLGNVETLEQEETKEKFEIISREEKIYKKFGMLTKATL